MLNKRYFIDNPHAVASLICAWWFLWATIALLSEKFIPPVTSVNLFFVLGVTFFITVFGFVGGKYRKRNIEYTENSSKYPLFKIKVAIGFGFFFLVCLPLIIQNPIEYRLNTFSDDARGIESIIFPNPGVQFIFTQLFYFFPLTGLVIATFNGEKTLFRQSALLLVCYALVTLSRGIYLTIIMLFLFMPGIKLRFLKLFAVIAGLGALFETYVDYHILGFSLLEKFINENNLNILFRAEGINTFNGFLWPIFSFVRMIDKSFRTDFELLASDNSLFTDIGRSEELYFNAFDTMLQAPVYDFGLSSSVILGLILGLFVALISAIKDKFLYRSLMGLVFITCLNGVQMNSISDRLILTYVIIVFLIRYKFYARGK